VGEAAPGPGAATGTGLPGSSWGAEVGFCAIVGTLADDLRLEPNPSPLKREFIELIGCRRINKESVGRRQMELNQSVRRGGKGKGWTERLLLGWRESERRKWTTGRQDFVELALALVWRRK
jgi:hypothetical protein